ncbi:MAG TPA: hypothetical protein VNQ31_06600, partial [Sphingomonadaceae bacterium]|nr:hypothetical protein [Sphingomonadaceae bacterium]
MARPLWIRIGRGVGIALGVIVLLVAVLLVGLNTPPGRSFLAHQIGGFETASGLRIGVGRIEGSLYGRMTLTGLEVRDPQGVFLRADRLTLDWRPFAYLTQRKVAVRELGSPEVRLLRRPALKPVPSDPNAPWLPDIDVALGRLAIDRLVIEPPVTGKRHVVRLAGSADIADGRARIRADARALAGPGVAGGDVLALTLDAVPDANRLMLDATLDAPRGGLVDSFTALGKPLAFSIRGRGDWAKWDGRLLGRVGGATVADLTLAARDGRVTVKGDTLPGAIVTGPAARLTAPELAVDLAATLAERRADLRLALRSRALAVDAAGRVDLGRNRFGALTVTAALLEPGSIAEAVRGRDIRLAATLDGPFATPAVAYKLSAASLGFGTMAVEGLAAEGKATVD